MYKRLESELVFVGISKKELAIMVGVQYNTILAKFRGESSFTLDEAFKIKHILKSDLPIDVLFEKTESAAQGI